MPPTDFDQTQTFSDTRFRLGPPDSGTLAARATPRAQRTAQQQQLLKQRRQLEERTIAGKGTVHGGILQLLLDEEKAAQTGAREATAGMAYNQAKDATLQANGFGPDGRPMAPGAPQPGQRAASPASGQYQSPASAQFQSPAAAQQGQQPVQRSASQGFAMRKMPDGSFKTSSTINQSTGQTEQRQFETRDLALAFYGAGPQPAPAAGATSGVQIAQQPGAAPVPGQPARPQQGPEMVDSQGYGATPMPPPAQAAPAGAAPAAAPAPAPAPAEEEGFGATYQRSGMLGVGARAIGTGLARGVGTMANYYGQVVPSALEGAASAVVGQGNINAMKQYTSDYFKPMGTAGVRTPPVQAAQAAPAPAAAPAPVAAAPQSGPEMSDSSGYGSMPSTSRFASPTTKMKQTAKTMGTPRADAGTQDFFGQLDEYGF